MSSIGLGFGVWGLGSGVLLDKGLGNGAAWSDAFKPAQTRGQILKPCLRTHQDPKVLEIEIVNPLTLRL